MNNEKLVIIDEIINNFQKELKLRLKDHVIKIILFGSRARCNADEWSDYDFAVIVDKRNKKIEEIILDICGELFYEHSKLIGSLVFDEKEWELHKKLPIGVNINRDGISLF